MRKTFLESTATLFFALFTALGAAVQFPFLPYHPFTLQIISPLLAGAFLGRDKGALSQIIFLFLGILNLPFFSALATGFPAPSLWASPQFSRIGLKTGYLLGFVAAAYLVGKAIEENKLSKFWLFFLTMTGGVILIYVMGLANFRLVLGIPLTKSFYNWALPFFFLDLLKALFATLLFWRLKLIFKSAF